MTRTLGSVRKLPDPRTTAAVLNSRCFILQAGCRRLLAKSQSSLPLLPSRSFAHVRQEPVHLDPTWFTPCRPARIPVDGLFSSAGGHGIQQDHRPPDERRLRLGKTLRTLSPLLPNIFTQPFPLSILSSEISLHLFPSTHPHLPTVKGRVAYRAALWTAPVAWGSVPVVGNVKLDILSEKMVRTGHVSQFQSDNIDDEDPSSLDFGEEKLVVRWKTRRKPNTSTSPQTRESSHSTPSTSSSSSEIKSNSSTSTVGINRGLIPLLGGDQPLFSNNKTRANQDFTGLFIFTFDRHGRIATHIIEHADECSGTDKQRTSRVITLTDWLLGRAKWNSRRQKEEEGGDMIPGLATSRLLRVCKDDEGGAQGRVGGGR